jgi:hypothetical protein
MQAVLGLLLPLGYQYEPGLVLLARLPGCQVEGGLWQQLTCLLQGLALGHTLVLLQVGSWRGPKGGMIGRDQRS